jgi:hypothetical protein
MNYLSSLTSARQRDVTSKEAGDNSMTEKPPCGNPEIPKSRRQEEEHRAKAILPESQIDTGGSHSPLTPDMGRVPDAVRSVRLCELKQSRDGGGNKPYNDRTGRLRARFNTSFVPRDRLTRSYLLHGDGVPIVLDVPG